MLNISDCVYKTKVAWPKLVALSHSERCKIIFDIANSLRANQKEILEANQKDLQNASSLTIALQDRLTLTLTRLEAMIAGLEKIINLPDPLENTLQWKHINGLIFQKVAVPIGVILVIYEARPNVTTDTVGLALKTGNSAILKGSRQTKLTNLALAELIEKVLEKYKLQNTISFFPELSSEESIELISHTALDLVIPRGGESLKKLVNQYSKVPVLGAGGGVCHVYVSALANLEKAQKIIFNAKTQRPSVCNSLETVLIHKDLCKPEIINKLLEPCLEHGVLIKADKNIVPFNETFEENTDWTKEYLDLILGIKVVAGVEEAIEHINKFGTHHSDSIITEDSKEADLFCKMIDSACVYVNASTRFTDGEEFGFGAEIGISTQKLHARGSIGPKELTTYKYLIKGSGQIR